MKNRKKASQIKAVTTIIRKLKVAGLRPTFHILENEVSTDLIEFLETDEKITVQSAPVICHQRNAAERAIRTFKNHFIAGLCTAHKKFPLNKWDSLLPQAFITLNLLHTSRLKPKLSAHALLNGPYNFNATLMAPPGSKILVHKKPALRGTWAAHAVNAWYLGPTLHHYWCYHVYISETRVERIADNVVWFPIKGRTQMYMSTNLAITAAHNLITVLWSQHPALPISPLAASKVSYLKTMAEIFKATVDEARDHEDDKPLQNMPPMDLLGENQSVKNTPCGRTMGAETTVSAAPCTRTKGGNSTKNVTANHVCRHQTK